MPLVSQFILRLILTTSLFGNCSLTCFITSVTFKDFTWISSPLSSTVKSLLWSIKSVNVIPLLTYFLSLLSLIDNLLPNFHNVRSEMSLIAYRILASKHKHHHSYISSWNRFHPNNFPSNVNLPFSLIDHYSFSLYPNIHPVNFSLLIALFTYFYYFAFMNKIMTERGYFFFTFMTLHYFSPIPFILI